VTDAERLSPALRPDNIIARQACFRPITEDGLPVIGRVPRIEGAPTWQQDKRSGHPQRASDRVSLGETGHAAFSGYHFLRRRYRRTEAGNSSGARSQGCRCQTFRLVNAACARRNCTREQNSRQTTEQAVDLDPSAKRGEHGFKSGARPCELGLPALAPTHPLYSKHTPRWRSPPEGDAGNPADAVQVATIE
jgi:hypothetical protein